MDVDLVGLFSAASFGAYLGGIETVIIWAASSRNARFGAYLGGIETTRAVPNATALHGVWSLPRRD